MLQEFKDYWRRQKVTGTNEETGEPTEFTIGIPEALAELEVFTIPVLQGGEKVQVVEARHRDKPLFTLEGPKARQFKVLEDNVRGHLNRRRHADRS